ncbi:hypothetical protein [Mycobacterium sp. URHB0044]|jgi:hypothetical protein|uniref:hypothetical protein n=1 Tax=Mycobacterium sp. URHB0044 TaxID=1380386 RepID=UPI0009DCD95E|nr:hypothetical protein [Mycobacterium sp. URHB0044]
MNTYKITKIVAGAVLSGGVAIAGMSVAPAIANATEGPFTWCPGQSMDWPSGPNRWADNYSWDMNVCHTWYQVAYGYGNVPARHDDGTTDVRGSSAWDGANPPGPNPSGINCSPFWCPVPPHPDPNFHA